MDSCSILYMGGWGFGIACSENYHISKLCTIYESGKLRSNRYGNAEYFVGLRGTLSYQ